MKNLKICILAILVALMPKANLMADDATVVKKVVEEIIAARQLADNEQLNGYCNLSDTYLDIDFIGEVSLGVYWKDLSAEQKLAYMHQVKSHMANLMISMSVLSELKPENLSYTSQGSREDIDYVKVLDSSDNTFILIALRTQADTSKRMVDVVVKGAGMVAQKGAEFRSVARRQGIDKLIELLKRLNNKGSGECNN